MAIARRLVRLDDARQLMFVAQALAQHAVDDAFQARRENRGRIDRLVHDRVRLIRTVLETMQRNQQQGVQRNRQGLVQQAAQDGGAAPVVAQRPPREVANRAARRIRPAGIRAQQPFVGLGQIGAPEDRLDERRRLQQGIAETVARKRGAALGRSGGNGHGNRNFAGWHPAPQATRGEVHR